MLFVYDSRLGLLVAGALLFDVLIRLVFIHVSRRIAGDRLTAQAKENTRFLETLRAIQTIKVAGAEQERESLWRNLSADVINPGVYRVTVDSDVSYCTPTVNTYSGKGVYGSAYAFAGTSIYVYTWYISGSTHLETASSYYFYLSVDC